jgi:protein-disulfide isomerase
MPGKLQKGVLALGLLTSLVPSVGNGQQQEPLATVDGEPVNELDLLKLAGSQLAQLRNQEYQIKSGALQEVIRQKLLEREAKKRGVSSEKLLEQEVNAKVPESTELEIEAFYLAQKDRINRPMADVRAQIAAVLKRAKTEKAREQYLDSLRQKAEVAVYLRPPKTEVSFDPSRLRGNPKAPVTIVEFSDFECPFCTRVQPTLKEVLAKYEGRVRLSYRDFPLREMHPKALSAAEAARCAADQGKFWEYHDALFADRSKLDSANLVDHARVLNLDIKSFESCLSSGKYKAKVEQDAQEGGKAGVSGTPAFFINGVFLSGAQPLAEFEKIIDAELAAVGSKPSTR